ncbi:hypothetical protein EDM22_16955 [Agromyces tardus]|uniref:PH domain-containing protein n=1 Tax=Agromyces tardus TaxID=2583849 RepID=A0A3M8A1I4_9MICO|nr:hypothetical protein [Agromyces tardus]RNB45110.1 hypothetical protein EDM22_16955 [Agromyces tardus]
MDKLPGLLVAVAVVALAAWLMWRSWRRRTVRDASLGAYPVPATLGAASVGTEALYVATTPEGQPLERLAVEGLAFRGSARLEIVPEGVLIRIAGESTSFIPREQLVGAGVATYAIDRGVEPEGLVAITWIVRQTGADDETPAPRVDSYLRARYAGDSATIIAAVNDIAAAPAAQRPELESEASDD